MVGCAKEVFVGRFVAVAIVGRHDTMAMTGIDIHRIVLPCRLQIGNLGDEQSLSWSITPLLQAI